MSRDDLFQLKEEDLSLIEAAVELGDWLIRHGATDMQREVIRLLQDALRRLPEPTRSLNADYGFRVEDRRVREADRHRHISEPEKIPVPYPDQAIQRSWSVAMYPVKRDHRETGQTCLEISSTFSDLPRRNVIDEMPHELDFFIHSGASAWPSTYNHDRWIREVGDPTQYIGEHELIEIKTWLMPADDGEGSLEHTDLDPALLH